MRERRDRVVADLGEVRRHGERSAVEVVEHVAVGRRPGDGLHRHAAGVAGAVLEHERLTEERLQRARQRPRAGFSRTAGCIADHQADGLRRV